MTKKEAINIFRRPTLRQVAKLAGVSPMAVSLALRNHSGISELTREKIRAIAKRVKYRPDPMLARLAVYRYGLKKAAAPSCIAYLINWPSRELWLKEHCETRFFAGAKQHAEELGYKLEDVWSCRTNMSRQRLERVLHARNYDGLLISDTPHARGHLTLDWSRLCAVKIGHSLVHPRLHCVENDQYRILQIALRMLRRKGYRRIGLALRASTDEAVNHMCRASYLVETDRPRAFEKIPPLLTADWNMRTFGKWFSRHRPEVVMSPHLKALNWLSVLGLKVPRDIGFVDLDCADRSGARAGIYQHHERVGAVALDILLQLIQRNERGIPDITQVTLLEGSWIEGRTLKPQRRPASG